MTLSAPLNRRFDIFKMITVFFAGSSLEETSLAYRFQFLIGAVNLSGITSAHESYCKIKISAEVVVEVDGFRNTEFKHVVIKFLH